MDSSPRDQFVSDCHDASQRFGTLMMRATARIIEQKGAIIIDGMTAFVRTSMNDIIEGKTDRLLEVQETEAIEAFSWVKQAWWYLPSFMPMNELVDVAKRIFDLCDRILQHAEVEGHKDAFANEGTLVEWLKSWSATLNQSQLLVTSTVLSKGEGDYPKVIGFLKTLANKWPDLITNAVVDIAVAIVTKGLAKGEVAAVIETGGLPTAVQDVTKAGLAFNQFKMFMSAATHDAPVGNILDIARHLADVASARKLCPRIFEGSS
eukprot:4834108-Pyramimonas_sp.AAC.1